MIATSRANVFFASSDAEKGAIHPSSRSHNRGYSGIGNEKVRDQVCMKENFDCGNPEDDERRNSWPTEELLPGFRHFTEDFFQVQISLENTTYVLEDLKAKFPSKSISKNLSCRSVCRPWMIVSIPRS